MPEMETGFYPRPQPPANPLELLSAFAATRNALMQGRTMQAEFEYKQAIGSVMSSPEVVDKETGIVSAQRGASLLSQDPRTTAYAGRAFTDLQALQKQQTENATSSLTLKMQQGKTVADAATAALAKPNFGRSDVVGAVNSLVAQGVIPKNDLQIASLLQSIPEEPNKLRAWLDQVRLRFADEATKAEMQFGKVQQFAAGNRIVVGAASPMGGFRPITEIEMGMTPETATSPAGTFNIQDPSDPTKTKRVQLSREQLRFMQGLGFVPESEPPLTQNLTPAQRAETFTYTGPDGVTRTVSRGAYADWEATGKTTAPPGQPAPTGQKTDLPGIPGPKPEIGRASC